jgi:ferredoxin
MREFVSKNMDSLHGKKVIIFCTQQILSGDGARAFADLFKRGIIQVIYAEHFFMPSNIFPITTNADKIKKYFNKSQLKLQRASLNIANGKIKKRGFNLGSRMLGFIQAPLLLPFEKRANKSIKLTDDCNKCGLCVSTCPMRNLVLENNRISHNHNCTACYRCVNRCPQKAITVAFHGKVKKHYGGL